MKRCDHLDMKERKGCKIGKLQNLVGQTFGRLTVIERVVYPEDKRTYWMCECACGNKKIVWSGNLKNGTVKSCGCLKKENGKIRGYNSAKHGMTNTHIYKVWRLMKQRCNNPNKDNYRDYGGRGIAVCDEWNGDNGFLNFYSWSVNNGYNDSLQIDRINNDEGYSPDNCRWVTNKANMRNRRVTRYVDSPFGRISVPELADRINGDYSLIYTQVYKGKHDIDWIIEHYKDTRDCKGEKYKWRLKNRQ